MNETFSMEVEKGLKTKSDIAKEYWLASNTFSTISKKQRCDFRKLQFGEI